MIREFVNNLNVPDGHFYVPDPYFKVRIDSIDNPDYSLKGHLNSFNSSTETEYKGNLIGMKQSVTGSSCTFERTVNYDFDGNPHQYMCLLYVRKTQKSTGSISIHVHETTYDSINETYTESAVSEWDDHGCWIRIPLLNIPDWGGYPETLPVTMSITLPKHCYAGDIIFRRMTRYEGGRDTEIESEKRLDLINLSWTKNGVNEIDSATIEVVMKEDYYDDDNPFSHMVFDFGDHVTIWVGEDKQSTIPVFGGYVEGWELSNNKLIINCIDRLFDLGRTYISKNFSIGYIPETNTSSNMPFTQFPNVNEIARYLCTCDYGIDFGAITRDYIFYNNFALPTSVSDMSNSGWEVTYDVNFGHPAPSMRIRPDSNTAATLTLYSDTIGIWDAAVYNYFNFDYYVSGAGIKFPVKFNVEFDMYKKGETIDNAITYTIFFNGNSTATNIIGNITPAYNGNWQNFTVDLKKLFDTKAPSSSYFISAVRIVGTQEDTIMLNKKCSSIYFDQIMAYRDFQAAPRYASADKKTGLEELQDLCEKTNHIAYTRAGDERRDDQLILIPKRWYTLPVKIDESWNVLDVSSLKYTPLDWGLKNVSSNTFTYNENTTGTSEKISNDSIKRYDILENHEALSDVNTQLDADTYTQQYIDEHAFMYTSFDATVQGSVLFEPGQMVYYDLPSYHIQGTQEVKSLSYDIDCVNFKFETQIGFGQPNKDFTNYLRDVLKSMRSLNNLTRSLTYSSYGTRMAGLSTSTGAMTNF